MAQAPQARTGPIVIDLDPSARIDPAAAPAPDDPPDGAVVPVAGRAAVPGSAFARAGLWLVGTVATLALYLAALAAWDRTLALLAARPVLGWIAAVLLGAVLLAAFVFALREIAGFLRVGRIDALRSRARAALAVQDAAEAQAVADDIVALYRGRPDMAWALARHAGNRTDTFDAEAALALVERDCLGPLDRAAGREIEAAARQVATVTALVPLALADVAAALVANLRMVRRIAAIYGGRSGALGTWRLMRHVGVHLIATGAVAVGDDLIQSLAGGGLLAKLSRRFGEGVINGALTARVGLAAVEVCRPLPFRALERPKVGSLLAGGLKGLFTSSRDRPARGSGAGVE